MRKYDTFVKIVAPNCHLICLAMIGPLGVAYFVWRRSADRLCKQPARGVGITLIHSSENHGSDYTSQNFRNY